jgi:16S rRNA (guanine527-N7)-methyltransferase
MEADDRLLVGFLEEAQRRGLLGPPPVGEHIAHARAFAEVIEATGAWPGHAVDLGAGGGIPGLVLALHEPECSWMLLDSRDRAARFLSDATAKLGLAGRVDVVHERAEVVGRSTRRGRADVVLARAFGPPAAAAECAAPLLRIGGRLVVSEPPDASSPDRWDSAALDQLGMGPAEAGVYAGVHFVVVTQRSLCPDRFPRRSGVPARRTLF